MKNARTIALVIALITTLAFGGFYLYKTFIGGGSETAEAPPPPPPPVDVAVLNKGIEKDKQITEADITITKIPAEQAAAIVADAVESPADVIGKYATTTLRANEYIYPDRITDRPRMEGLQRVAVNLTPIGAVAGTVEKGDKVSIRVLAQKSDGSGAPAPVTLSVSAEIAELLNDGLVTKENFVKQQQPIVTPTQAPGVPPAAPAAEPAVTFVPKYAVIYVTPKEANEIIKYDNTDFIRLAVNE